MTAKKGTHVSFAILSWAAAITVSLGCTSILGDNFKLQDADPTTTGPSGMGGSGGAGGVAGAGGGPIDAGSDVTMGGDGGPVCQPGQKDCQGTTLLVCNAKGAWQTEIDCPNVCTNGACAGVCRENTTKCEDNKEYRCGPDGTWSLNRMCGACAGNLCAGCTPGTPRCNGQSVEVCTPAGVYQAVAMCPFLCRSDVCAGSCATGAKQCGGMPVANQPQSCDMNNTWSNNGAPCPVTTMCSQGTCTACTANSTQCAGNLLQTCTGGAWVTTATCPSVCKPTGCVGVCSPNQTRCMGNSIQLCDANGAWVTIPCPGVCDTTGGVAACRGACSPTTTRCNGSTQQLCTSMGTWLDAQMCANVCVTAANGMGSCGGMCKPGARQCMDKVPQICDNAGSWVTGTACPFLCVDGSCTAADAGASSSFL